MKKLQKGLFGAVLAAALFVTPAWGMGEKVQARDSAAASVERGRGVENAFNVVGRYTVEIVRDGAVVYNETFSNTVTTQGKRYLLDAALDDSAAGHTEQTIWYVALVSTNTAGAATYVYDTFLDGATIPATEFVSYAGGVRPTWTGVLDGTLAVITNAASRASFAITGSGTIYGAALVSLNTLSDHTAGDYLFSYATFASPITVVNADTVNVTVAITLN